jgi:hypothetical protein
MNDVVTGDRVRGKNEDVAVKRQWRGYDYLEGGAKFVRLREATRREASGLGALSDPVA